MYVKEIFAGLNPANHPDVKTFDNVYGYDHMLVERNITLNSTCEHHFLPIVGVAHVAYIPEGRVVGLSKLNRIVDHYAKRPQVQERLVTPSAESLAIHFGHTKRGRGDGCQTLVRVQPWHPGRRKFHCDGELWRLFETAPEVRAEFLQHIEG